MPKMSPRFVLDLECRCRELERDLDRLWCLWEDEDLWCLCDDLREMTEAPSQLSKKPMMNAELDVLSVRSTENGAAVRARAFVS